MSRQELTRIAEEDLITHNIRYASLKKRVPPPLDEKMANKRVKEWNEYKTALEKFNTSMEDAAQASRALCLAAKKLADTYPNGAVDVCGKPLLEPTMPEWTKK